MHYQRDQHANRSVRNLRVSPHCYQVTDTGLTHPSPLPTTPNRPRPALQPHPNPLRIASHNYQIAIDRLTEQPGLPPKNFDAKFRLRRI